MHSGNIYKTVLAEDVWQLFVDGRMQIIARWPNAATHPVLEGYRVPVHPELQEVMGSPEEALRMALTGGEDYEVCFTAAPGSVDEEIRRSLQDEFGVIATKVGWVEEGEGVYLSPGEGISPLPVSEDGFDHFRTGRS